MFNGEAAAGVTIQKINAGLDDYMRRHNLDDLSRLTGTLELNSGAEAWCA